MCRQPDASFNRALPRFYSRVFAASQNPPMKIAIRSKNRE
jgi:hypothetical protein